MKKRLLILTLVLALVLTWIPAARAEGETGEKIVYGYSGEGRELVAWRYGHGDNVMIVGFGTHGWEDNWNADGEALVYTAEKLRAALSAEDLAGARGWSVYVLPCINPDGLYNGKSHDGPGRCTTTYYDANGQLKNDKGIDLNRCFPTNFKAQYSNRYYTGATPLACREARALAEFLRLYKGTGDNILLDVHGWNAQTITYTGKDGLLNKTFAKQFPKNVYTPVTAAPGYLIAYGHTLGYDSCLLELPGDVKNMTAFVSSGYSDKVVGGVVDLIKTREPSCADGHKYVDTRVEPTCTVDGKLTQVCSVCGDTKTTVLPATGKHTYKEERVEPTCTEAGSVTSTCQVCGKVTIQVLPAQGHSAKNGTLVVVKYATATRDGQVKATCGVCGKTDCLFALPRVFKDTKEAFYSDAVDCFYAAGIMAGMSADRFEPNVSLNRAMLVSILYRCAGEPAADVSKLTFTDVGAGKWYAKPIAWALENGIVYGITDKTFEPNTVATREQTAAILFRFADYLGLDTSASADVTKYTDWSTVSSYARSPMAWCIANGILYGTTDTTLTPKGVATRAQAAVLCYRMMDFASMLPSSAELPVEIECLEPVMAE